jgi:hypothetical protein
MDCIDYWNCSSPKEVTYFSGMRRLHPAPLLLLLVELMLSLSPRKAHFVRCVVVIFSVIGTVWMEERLVLRLTASGRFSNHLVSVLLRYHSVLQQPFLLMVSAYSADMIVSKHISQRWLSVRLFDGVVEWHGKMFVSVVHVKVSNDFYLCDWNVHVGRSPEIQMGEFINHDLMGINKPLSQNKEICNCIAQTNK